MARVTTIVNQKGGVGKTTTAHALATGLTRKGYKVLVIDTDPQGNLSYAMGADSLGQGLYEVMKNESKVTDLIQRTRQGDILPSTLMLTGADVDFTQMGREFIIKEALEDVKTNYSHIIIDSPPTLGILTINALTASDDIIVPLGADIFSLQGLSQLNTTINKVRRYGKSKLKIAGLLVTKFSGRTILGNDVKEEIDRKATELDSKVYNVTIRDGVAIKEAQLQQQSIYEYAPQSNPVKDYMELVDEYLMQEDK